MKKILSIAIGIILVIILFVGGKKHMDRKVEEKVYQDGIELIQNYVTDYLVNNYEGIEKIEWQGVGVEWRNSPIFGPSIFGNYVDTDVDVYISKYNHFTMNFLLSEETEYDDELNKYILYENNGVPVLNPSNIGVSVEVGIHNAIYKYDNNTNVEKLKVSKEEKLAFDKVKKSSSGSPNAEVVYNLKVHELKY